MLLIILLVVAVGAIIYLLMRPNTTATSTPTSATTIQRPMPAPVDPYANYRNTLGMLGGMGGGGPAVDPNAQAGWNFAGKVVDNVGSVFGSLAKAGVFGGGD